MVMDKLVPAPYRSQQHPLSESGKNSLHCQVLAERDVLLTKVSDTKTCVSLFYRLTVCYFTVLLFHCLAKSMLEPEV